MLKRARSSTALSLAAAALAACAPTRSGSEAGATARAATQVESRRYTNPVLDRDFPDPAVLRAPDGMYYAYATQTEVAGRPVNIQVARSADLVHWTELGDALPVTPTWSTRVKNFWAPHVIYDAARMRYYMYFSAHGDAQDGKCLAVATSTAPTGPFTDKGSPLVCGPGFVDIDPMAFDDPVTGKHLLYWGSGFQPIRVQELTADRLGFAPASRPVDVVAPRSDSTYNVLIEGAWVIHRQGYYYLFYSGDNCCGDKAHYAVMVARSQSPFGPFERLGASNGTGSSVILAQDGSEWRAPGHNSIVTDDAGQDWILYHAIDPGRPLLPSQIPSDRADRRVMLMDRIVYRDGWPEVVGGHPSRRPQPAPVVRPHGQ